MIDQATQALKTTSRRMLDRLAHRLHDSPTLDTAERVLDSFTQPWAEVFAYCRLATLADGMVDAWDALPFDLDETDQEEAIHRAQQLRQEEPEEIEDFFADFSPEERLLTRPWFGLPPPPPPGELIRTHGDDDDIFGLRLPTYDWALRQLARRHLVTREEWDALEDDELSQAFTVAGLQTEAALGRVRDLLGETLREGWTLPEFKETVGVQNFLSEAHAETVFRTALHQSYSDGKMALVQEPLVLDAFPYATIDPIGDDRVRPEHLVLATAGLNGTNIYRLDDPVFVAFRPPWDFNCFLPDTQIEGRFELGIRAWYDGKTIKITTRSGKTLSVTINHPILTANGFARAGDLAKGDQVISYKTGAKVVNHSNSILKPPPLVQWPNQASFSTPGKNEYYTPSTVEQVYQTLSRFGFIGGMPVRPNDLYGDIEFSKGDIDVVGATGQLLLDFETATGQDPRDLILSGMDLRSVEVATSGHLSQLSHRFNSTATSHPGRSALSQHSITRLLDRLPFHQLRFGPASQLDASRYETPHDDGPIYGSFAGDLLERNAGQVFLDEIIEVRHENFVGHVYDFQTEGGWILSNGIFASNCRCDWGTLTIRQAAERGVAEAANWLRTGEKPWAPARVPWPTYRGRPIVPNPAYRRAA